MEWEFAPWELRTAFRFVTAWPLLPWQASALFYFLDIYLTALTMLLARFFFEVRTSPPPPQTDKPTNQLLTQASLRLLRIVNAFSVLLYSMSTGHSWADTH